VTEAYADVLSERLEEQQRLERENRMLRSRLKNLTLSWELKALAFEAQEHTKLNAENVILKERVSVYRKCISEVTEILELNSKA
jgi:hypothetical protein